MDQPSWIRCTSGATSAELLLERRRQSHTRQPIFLLFELLNEESITHSSGCLPTKDSPKQTDSVKHPGVDKVKTSKSASADVLEA